MLLEACRELTSQSDGVQEGFGLAQSYNYLEVPVSSIHFDIPATTVYQGSPNPSNSAREISDDNIRYLNVGAR